MTLIPNVYLQFRDGQTYSPKQVNPDVVTEIAWDYQEQGGLAQIAATLAVPWETTPILPGDYMEVWVLGETVPRARGIVSTPENHLDLKESKTLLAFGRMADMDKTLDYKVIYHPSGSAQDLSYYGAELLSDYQQRKAAGAAFAPTLDIDFQITGSSLESLTLSPASVRSGFDQIYAQAGGNVVWGWDIHPVTGNDRCYLRLRTSVVGTQFFIGSSVKLLTAPAELAPVTNAVYLRGGPAKYPNLITNASFEQPVNPSADSGSLLQNGGFELPASSTSPGGDTAIDSWTGSGGVTRNTHDAGSNHNASPHSGLWYLLLDRTGKSAYQEVAVTPGANNPYLATVFVRCENAQHPPVGALTITGRDSSDNVTETPLGGALPLAPQSAAWTGGAASAVVGSDSLQTSVVFTNPATVKARVTLTCSSTAGDGFGLCIDDVTFGPVGAVGQYGWSTHLQNPGNAANAFNWIIWACKAAAWDGAYGVRASVTANFSNKPVIAIAGNDNSGDSRYHFSPAPQQSLVCGFFARMAPGLNSAAGAVRAEYREWAGDGHETQHVYNPPDPWSTTNIPNDGQWHLVTVSIFAHGDAASATVQAAFGASGVYDIDGFFARDAAAVVTGAQEPQAANYLRGVDFERYVKAADVCTSGSPADLAAAASEGLWSRREALLTNDQIVDWNGDAAAYLQAYFQRSAVLLQRPRVEISGDFSTTVLPGDGKQVAVNGTSTDLLPQWCSHASYTFKKSSLEISLDLSSERPTWAKLLKAAQASGGSAGGSVGAPAGGGQTGAGTPSAPPVTSVNTHTGDVVLGAADVGAEPALGNPAATGYVLTSTLSGTRSWIPAPAGSGGSGTTQVVATPPPYYRFHQKFSSLGRIPVASDFSGTESLTYFAEGLDGSLRYETPGLALDAFWKIGLQNTTGAAVTVSWSVPWVDNYASGDWNGTSLFSVSASGAGSSGTFSIAAGATGYLSLFYANNNNAVYDTTNQGVFWFLMDALLSAGVVMVDPDTGLTPGTVVIGDATPTAPGLVEVHASPASGHPVVYLASEVDTLLTGKISVGAALAESEITGLISDLAGKIATGTALPESEITGLVSDLAGKIATGTALPESEITSLISDLAGKISTGAALPESEITGLVSDLAGKLAVGGTAAVGQVATVVSVGPTVAQWQTPAVPKRRMAMTFYPASTTADTVPNTSQMSRFLHGTAGATTNWKPSGPATLHAEGGGTSTVQIYYAPSSAAFGSGTAILGSALSVTGTGVQESNTTTFSSGATAGIPSGYEAAPLWSAVAVVAGTYCTVQFEEV